MAGLRSLLTLVCVVAGAPSHCGADHTGGHSSAATTHGKVLEEVRLFNKIFGLDESADNYITTAHASLQAQYARRLRSNFSEYGPLFDPDTGKMQPRGVMLLHHMKTGGTSMGELLHCACQSQPKSAHCRAVDLSECAEGSVERCYNHSSCTEKVGNATVATYCTSLHDVDRFGWAGSRMVSVLRHPVERLWSLYRFYSRPMPGTDTGAPPCFSCVPLADVYEMLDNGTIDKLPGTTDVCKRSLSNYMTLFYTGAPLRGDDAERYSVTETPTLAQKQLMLTAYFNMWNRSALVLHTEDLSDGGFRMLQAMSPRLFGSGNRSSNSSSSSTATDDDTNIHTSCALEHANASPDLDACGRDLAAVPDERTRQLILAHNQMDVLLYKASLRMYELQRRILLGENTSGGDDDGDSDSRDR